MRPSLVPAVVDKLLEHAADAAPDGFDVFDGPVRDWDTKQKFVMLGWPGQPDTHGIDVEVTRAGAAQHVEVINVRGAVHVSFGNKVQKDARDLAYEVLAALVASVTPRLDVRGVTRTELTQHSLEPFVGTGAGCFVTFTIRIEGIR